METGLLKLIFSKEFIQNATTILSILKKNKDWKKDIVNYSDTFYKHQVLDSAVLIDQSLAVLKEKGWEQDEIKDTNFIMQELIRNAFAYGLPNNEYSNVFINITITTPFIRISISDNGTFNLKEELIEQEYTIPGSDKNKGLSFVFQITPEITQNKQPRNEIIVIKRKGSKPLQKIHIGDVLVLKVGTSNYLTDDNYELFANGLYALRNNRKIVVDFNSDKYDVTFVTRVVRRTRTELKSAMHSGSKVCVCGLKTAPIPIKTYFAKMFHIEEDLDHALQFLNEDSE